jgi:hypothetical protein
MIILTPRDVRSLHVQGLTDEAVAHLWGTWGLTSSPDTIAALMRRYAGHPLALKRAAMTVQELFAGNLEAFLSTTLPVVDELRTVLDQQFVRLLPLEKEIILYLVSVSQPMPFQALGDTLCQPHMQPILLEAMRALQGRSLLTIGAEGLSLPPGVTAYIAHYVHETVH